MASDLLLIVTLLLSWAGAQGLELTLNHTMLSAGTTGDPCGLLVCQAKGNSVTMTSLKITRVNSNQATLELLAVSSSNPGIYISLKDLRGHGTLATDSAYIHIDLLESTSCNSGYFLCEASFTKQSGETEHTFATTGPGQGPISQPVLDKPDNLSDHQSLSCDRGMGFDVTKNYPPYVIVHHEMIQKQILCDTHTVGGGWIVFQRRSTGDVDFFQDWDTYREGFGFLEGDFYLGNDAIHNLTSDDHYELRIDLIVDGEELFAQYSSFKIEDEFSNYRLSIGSYSGTIGEENVRYGMSYHDNKPFSTKDRDNDSYSGNCSDLHHGAWWYYMCNMVNLNGEWGVSSDRAVKWNTGNRWRYPTFTEMKIRRVEQKHPIK